ncbi:hypothetical protein [Methanopyrus sp.]
MSTSELEEHLESGSGAKPCTVCWRGWRKKWVRPRRGTFRGTAGEELKHAAIVARVAGELSEDTSGGRATGGAGGAGRRAQK